MRQLSSEIVQRDEVPVMFLRTEDAVPAIQRGWARLESLVSLRGRRFYGAFDPRSDEYWVCTELKEGDDPAAIGLESGTLPGGRFARAQLRGEPPFVYDQIGPAFQALMRSTTPDRSRPQIEFYRQRDVIDCLLPC